MGRRQRQPEPRDWGLTTNAQDHLVCGGADLVELGRRYGTPLHVVAHETLIANARQFELAFAGHGGKVRVFYSYKTNCVPGVLRALHEQGTGAEVVSPFELWLALRLGVPPSDIVLNGVNKAEETLALALERGVASINLDSAAEVACLVRLAVQGKGVCGVGIRVRPRPTHFRQFGFDLENGEALAAFRSLLGGADASSRSRWSRLGIHCHVGSNVKDPAVYGKAVKRLGGFLGELKAQLGLEVDFLDLGGGIGVTGIRTLGLPARAWYRLTNQCPSPEAPGQEAPVTGCAARITETLAAECRARGLRVPELWLEPGRAVTAKAQLLLATVRTLKQDSRGTTWALTDTGPANVARPVVFEYHEAFVASQASAARTKPYRVTGRMCASSDILYPRKLFPALGPGDILAVMDTGAYFTSLDNTFGFPRPPVVMVRDGVPALIRRPESFEDVVARDEGAMGEGRT